IRHYILDGSNADLRRLLSISQVTAETARAAFDRIGIQDGWNVIDCGCGPIGGVPVLAEMGGPTRRVGGGGFSEPTVQRARAVGAELQLDTVEVMVGDIHELDAAPLGGPFDLAFTRLFLMHQADLARALTRISGLLRPAGWLITQEALRSPAPRSHPHVDALEAYWALLYRVMESSGARPRAIDDLPRTAPRRWLRGRRRKWLLPVSGCRAWIRDSRGHPGRGKGARHQVGGSDRARDR